jgi:hypothetical protein
MKSKRPSCNQLDAEILDELRGKSGSAKMLSVLLHAPKRTIKWHMDRLLRNGQIDAIQGPRQSIIYYLPGSLPEPPDMLKFRVRGKAKAKKGQPAKPRR